MKLIRYVVIWMAVAVTGGFADNRQDEMLKKIQDYLNGIKSLQAEMAQTNADQSQQNGRIFLKRDPNLTYGKLRLEYTPAKDLIIVDGRDLRHKDLITKEVSTYSVESTPAAFLLKKNLQFGKDMQVQSVQDQGDQIVLKLVNIGDADGMSLILKLTTKPFLKLTGWEVYDGQGNTTRVELHNVQINVKVSDHLFKLD
jgi:outer membrane lipoprotein-sorting protein